MPEIAQKSPNNKDNEHRARNDRPDFGGFVLSGCWDKMCRKQEISIDNYRHKNGRNARKTAIPAETQIAPRGFEPLEEKSQSTIKQALRKTSDSVFATGFAKMMQESAVFSQIVRDVMKLSSEQKKALVRMLLRSR